MSLFPPPDPTTLLGMPVDDFLRDYWQKRPLLIRNALPGFENPLAADELAGLACEDGIDSRLIIEHGPDRPWQASHGPFSEDDFAALPEREWTLLVQDIEKHLPAFTEILGHFDFLPRWRLDDLMISYAVDGGSVGPHTDQYDVFLIQAAGQRHWHIGHQPIPHAEYLPDIDLRILREFEADEDWLLNPGDMLYLPPHIAHHGIAVGECMTWSVGFRAPAQRDLLAAVIERIQDTLNPQTRYTDPMIRPASRAGEIDAEALHRAQLLVTQALQGATGMIDEAFATLVSESKPGFTPIPAEEPVSPDELIEALGDGIALETAPGVTPVWYRHGEGARLLVDGHGYDVAREQADLMPIICGAQALNIDGLADWLDDPDAMALLCELCNQGYLLAADEDAE